mmetsp:Transcript_116716/g.330168  ORF Transcript_116716/g.330168 Transcript_116716/m.330168 type:complete len:104 (+) Transcript_116716:190-501(+)
MDAWSRARRLSVPLMARYNVSEGGGLPGFDPPCNSFRGMGGQQRWQELPGFVLREPDAAFMRDRAAEHTWAWSQRLQMTIPVPLDRDVPKAEQGQKPARTTLS